MSKKALSELFRRWMKQSRARRTGSPTSAKARLRVEEVEERLAPATLPEVSVASTLPVANTGSAFQPQVVADPLNPNTLAMVASRGTGILGQISFDGGLSWSKFRDTASLGRGSVPVTGQGDPSGGKLLDPDIFFNNNGPQQITRFYTHVSSPSLAFARDGTIYITYLEHNADKTSGAVVVESFNYDRNAGTITQNDLDPFRDFDNDGFLDGERFVRANSTNNMANVLYQWIDDGGNAVNRALNPFIAVDNNVPAYTDPVTGLTTPVDGMVGNGVFVAWNTDANNPSVQGYGGVPAGENFTRNAIFIAASHNGGVDFSTPVSVNDGGSFLPGGHFLAGPNGPPAQFQTGGSAPQIVFSPGELSTNRTITPGEMSVFWQTTANRIARSASQPDGGVGDPAVDSRLFRSLTYDFPTADSIIADSPAAASGADPGAVTRFELPVDLTSDLNFTTLSDLDVTLAITHNNVSHLQIFLVAPDGTRVELVANRTRPDTGADRDTINGVRPGLPAGDDIGVTYGVPRASGVAQVRGIPVGTVFSAEAARQIHDPRNLGGDTPYVGSFRPETDDLTVFYGLTAAQLSSRPPDPSNLSNPTGNWVLEVRDVRADRISNAPIPDRYLRFWSLNFTSRLDNDESGGRLGADEFVAAGGNIPVGSNVTAGLITTIPNAPDQQFTNQPTASPIFGIGPGISLAYDDSLGSFSPFSGRLYLAYTAGAPGGPSTDTNVYLLSSDDNGRSWTRAQGTATNQYNVRNAPVPLNDDSITDNFTEGNRTQYMPTLTVDAATGMLVAMWYDARLDASNGRVSTFLATSIDGGSTFSPQTFANAPKTAMDLISREKVELEPVPSNVGAMPVYGSGTLGQFGGTGIRQSLVANAGQIKPFWTGNSNSGGSSIFSATVRTAAGPRIVGTDMGAVTGDAGDFFFGPYNNTFTADGTRQIDGFRVTFDRPIDVSSFDPSDVIVQFRSPDSARDASIPPTLIPVSIVQALDPFFPHPTSPASATEFFVRFANPQSAVGTYSWSIGPNISDRIRSSTTAVFLPIDTPVRLQDPGAIESTIDIPDLAGNPLVQELRVALNITHTFVSDLVITLIGPDGTQVVLFDGTTGAGEDGDNFTNTRFDDNGLLSIDFVTALDAPFNDVYRPHEPLGTFVLNNTPISGIWKLRVEDLLPPDTGTLDSWSLNFLDGFGNPIVFNRSGNTMDQDADSLIPELDNDVFTNPRSVSGVPFTLDFDPSTLPVILPGPHMIGASMPGNPATTDNLVLNGTASQIRIEFDRDIEPTSFTPAQILRMTGPVGPITGPFTVAPESINPVTGGARAFIITFPTQNIPGPYSIEFGPDSAGNSVRGVDRPQLVTRVTSSTNQITVAFTTPPPSFAASDIVRITGPNGPVSLAGVFVSPVAGQPGRYQINFPTTLPRGQYVVEFSQAGPSFRVAGSGVAVDHNFNAGLDVLRGDDPSSQTFISQVYPSTSTAIIAPGTSGTVQGQPGVIPTVTELPINITDDFIIRAQGQQQIQLSLNITHPNVQDLDLDLVSPTGKIVRLFTGSLLAPPPPNQTANFTNTLLIDRVNDPNVPNILLARPPFTPPSGQAFSPQTPLSVLLGDSSKGTWTLRVTNNGLNSPTTDPNFPGGDPQILGWSLRLPRTVPSTGLGEAVADRFSTGFRIFTQDSTNELTQQVWTPVGPAPTNETANSGRVTAIAVDPSDPSGNTVYVAAAGGGIWKTANFLTTDPNGPEYVPLTDLGPTFAVNIASLALFPRNNDPAQTIVYALTGEGNKIGDRFTGGGVGVLRSEDGGRTWQVLDSSNNVDAQGKVSLISDPARDHLFVGATGFKIVVDPNLSREGEVIVYMAVSGGSAGAAGVWRSLDSGDTWQLVQAGNATDVVLAAGSANSTDPVSGATVFDGNLQQLYAAFQGIGVFGTDSALTAVSLNPLVGGFGNPLIRDFGGPFPAPVGGREVLVNAPAGTPTGNKGRISLAVPTLTGDPLQDSFYKDWIYALVANPEPDGRTDGLYVSKDAGRNWTKIQIPTTNLPSPSGFYTDNASGGFGTNDENKPLERDVLDSNAGVVGGEGNYDQAIAVNPLDPNIIYIAGFGSSSIRLDLRGLRDSQAFVNYNNSDPGLNAGNIGTNGVQAITRGGIDYRAGQGNGPGRVVKGGLPTSQTYQFDILNLSRDFNQPFNTNATIRVINAERFVNDGADIRWQPFEELLDTGLGFQSRSENRFPGSNIHTVLPIFDPLTGQARFLYGTDDGVFTGVDRGDGTITLGIGFSGATAFNRNGNLQISNFVNGAVQPSQLAADLAGAMFYGQAESGGFPVSSSDVVNTGNLNWRGPEDDFDVGYFANGVWVETDPTGSGTSFQWRAPFTPGFDANFTSTGFDFFRVFSNTSDHQFGGGVSRTTGLIRTGEVPHFNQGQWPALTGFSFAVNPLNANALLIGSRDGSFYRTINQGVNWNQIAGPGIQVLGNGPIVAMAFGSSNPAQPSLTNNFIYGGTTGGQIFVTTTGGAPWTNISAGLDGSSVVKIVPNPEVGKRDAFAITTTGVFYKADGTSTAAPWVNITGNLFTLTRSVFGNELDQDLALRFLTSLAVDWRFAMPFPDDPTRTFPILYVSGEGGVFQSKDFGATWSLYPSVIGDGAPVEGGYLPNSHITDLDLSIGNLNPANGKYQAGGLNMLVATTYGRGMWAIRLDDTIPPPSFISGPRVTQLINPNTGGTSNRLQVRFSGPVDPATFTPADVSITRAGGAPVNVLSVQLISPTLANGTNARDLYEITFAPITGPTSINLVIGANPPSNVPQIADPSGFLMNQDGDTTNGEALVDQYQTSIFLNGATNNRLVVTTFPVTAVAGVGATVRIEARDANDLIIASANGTLTLAPATGTGPFTTTPTTVSMTNGIAQFTVSYTTAGPQTINASFGALNPTSWTTQVSAAAASSFTIAPPNSVVSAPATVGFTVTARDQFGNAAAYDGPITITSTGAAAVLPTTPIQMTGGTASFNGNFNTRGTVTVTASGPDLNNPATTFSASSTVLVDPGVATQLVITTPPGPFLTGSTVTVTVSALDALGNIANFNGPLAVTVSPNNGQAAVSPASPVFVNGQATFNVTLNAAGSYTIGVTSGNLSATSQPIRIQDTPPGKTPTELLTGVFGVGTGVDGSPVLQIFTPNGSVLNALVPFPAGFNGEVDPTSNGFTGGIRVSVADVTGDGVPDYVVGTGPTITATVQVINGATGQTVLNLRPFEDFKGGVFVTTGDITGDGVSEIIITPDEGGGPRVTVLRGGSFTQMANFFGIEDPNFRGGARAGAGDLNGDGFAEIVVSAGFSGGPRISIYDGAALSQGRILRPVGDFFMFEESLRNGAYVAVGDFDGDGFGDIAGGAGPGGAPRVLIVSGRTLLTQGVGAALNSPISNFFAGDTENRGGIRLAAKNFDGDNVSDLITGAGEGGGSGVTAYRGRDFGVLFNFDALPGYGGGVFVG